MRQESCGTSGASQGRSVVTPRLIVEVRYGKLAGTKKIVDASKSLRVGRTDLSDLVIAHDGSMSGVHFELQWDGSRCFLRDANSVSGTRLGGQDVKEGEVNHGGWIQAGETDFMVYVEGKTPPSRKKFTDEEKAEEDARIAAAHDVLPRLRAEAEKAPLYAVVDGARDRRIVELARQHVETHQSLYEGAGGENFEDMAPFLIGPMRANSALLDKLVLEGWGKRWGIYCASHEKFAEVRRHFRRFLMVELESSQEKVYFRFYDPGVFRGFWPTCSTAQKRELSEKLDEIFVEEKNHSLVALLRADRASRRA
jgi:pSer/pThr/pTyr-binding forkhead associated (FHA) protein